MTTIIGTSVLLGLKQKGTDMAMTVECKIRNRDDASVYSKSMKKLV